MRLLLVEDDEDLTAYLRTELGRAGYALDHARDGIDGQFMGAEMPYDAIVLDLGLPGKPGLELLRGWRSQGIETPVLVLTARDAWHERVDGLKSGADDYLGKPFHVQELLARLSALLRRAAGRASVGLEVGGLTLDEDRQWVRLRDGTRLDLTGTEFRLLRYFMLHSGKVLTASRLEAHVYDEAFECGSNLIAVYVRRLREKIGKDSIRTLRGQGYLFVDKS